jgi:multidrug resistance efflux pump
MGQKKAAWPKEAHMWNPNQLPKACSLLMVPLLLAACSGLGLGEQSEAIEASGMVEAQEILVASDMGGRVAEVFVSEGDMVSPGDPLLRLESQLLEVELSGARSSLAAAQANYDLLAAQPLEENRQAAIAAAELAVLRAQQELEQLQRKAALQVAEMELAVAQARDELDHAEDQWRRHQPGNRAPEYMLKAARARVVIAEKRLGRAQRAYEHTHGKIAKAKAQIALSEARSEYNQAVWYLDWLESGADEIQQALLDASLELAQESFQEVQAELKEMDGGPDPDALALAEGNLRSAEAELGVARVDTRDEQLAVAEAQVEAARVALELTQARFDRMTLRAPSAGTVLTRMVDPGEVISPGAPAMSIGQLTDLNVTVYVSERRYGQIRLGDLAQVYVDSFPGQPFEAVVTHIADEAEFTPRNVQTREERQTTVYAVELRLRDPDGKLKPGMPADVSFRPDA